MRRGSNRDNITRGLHDETGFAMLASSATRTQNKQTHYKRHDKPETCAVIKENIELHLYTTVSGHLAVFISAVVISATFN